MNGHNKYTGEDSGSARHPQYFHETGSGKEVPLEGEGQCLLVSLSKDTSVNFHTVITSVHDANQLDVCILQFHNPASEIDNLLHFWNQKKNQVVDQVSHILGSGSFRHKTCIFQYVSQIFFSRS